MTSPPKLKVPVLGRAVIALSTTECGFARLKWSNRAVVCPQRPKHFAEAMRPPLRGVIGRSMVLGSSQRNGMDESQTHATSPASAANPRGAARGACRSCTRRRCRCSRCWRFCLTQAARPSPPLLSSVYSACRINFVAVVGSHPELVAGETRAFRRPFIRQEGGGRRGGAGHDLDARRISIGIFGALAGEAPHRGVLEVDVLGRVALGHHHLRTHRPDHPARARIVLRQCVQHKLV